MSIASRDGEMKLTNSDPFMESTSTHSIYTL
jgi:hypothetical protein